MTRAWGRGTNAYLVGAANHDLPQNVARQRRKLFNIVQEL